MSYKRISVRFNMNVDAERNAWEIIHEKGSGLVGKEAISAIITCIFFNMLHSDISEFYVRIFLGVNA